MSDDVPVMYLVVRKHHGAQLETLLAAVACAVCNVLDEYGPSTRHARDFSRWRVSLYRKVTLRADEKEYAALADLPHCEHGGIVRVFPPVPRSVRPKALARLQTYDAPAEFSDAVEEDAAAVTIVVNGDVAMSAGKLAAQVGHAAMLAKEQFDADPREWTPWHRAGYPCVIRHASGGAWAEARREDGATVVVDAGFTEVAGGSETCLALPPTG